MHAQPSALEDWLPLGAFLRKHRDRFNENQIRWLLRDADRNGLVESGAALKFQGRWFLNERRFAGYMEQSARRGKSAA